MVDILFNAITPEGSKRIQIDDFIITLSVVIGSNRPPLMKLLFRVYDFQNLGRIELPRVEKLLTFVSGDSVTELAERKKVFAAVFAKAEFEGALVLREFEQYTDDHSVLSSWIFNIVESLTGPPPASLSKLEQKYSAETVELSLMKKLSLSASAIMRLKQVLQIRCGSNPRSELSLSSWIVLTKPYLSPALAYAVFCAKVRGIKPVWKLVEFAEFCVVFGGDDTPAKAQYLAEVFQTESQRVLKSSSSSRTSRLTMGLMSPKSVRLGPADAASLLADKTHMRRMVRLLAFSNEVTAASTPALSSVNVLSRESVAVALESVVSNLRQSRTSRLSAAPSSVDASGKARFSVSLSRGNVTDYQRPDLHALELKPAATAATGPSMSSHGLPYAWDPYNVPGQILPMDVTRDLLEIEDNTEGASEAPLGAYIKLISSNANLLPALNDLSLMACCVFAVRPSSPNKEKDYIAELFVKRELDTPFRASQPYGPVGTEWMIVSKTWYDNWQKYASQVLPRESIPKKAVKNTVSSPGEIDNKFVLKESEAKILLNGCVIGQQLEVLPPAVYSALASWYGGGPSIPRKVVTLENGASELELYPVHLRVCNCDLKGKTTDGHSDVLFSKSATVRDIVKQLADVSHIDIARVRLWNYASSNLQDQLQLTPEMTVAQAKLQDGQFLLLEICQTDGTWPRSQLGQQKVASPLVPSSTQTTSSEDSDERKSLGGDLVRNDGRVGLDNIGNTCYMNSTLQALVHTEPLAQYFLRGYFATDINTGNVMGHGGKMARLFARLMKELWTVDKDSVSPKKFHSDFTALAEQFSGFDQHDAQELMACILDGLSEDLNLIKSKPYVENPDSDGRPDCELADIWWANHCKRDKSVVQSLFCGQFRSNITCGCGAYSSARFEPFNFLTLPVPEEKDQSVTVFVMPEGSAFVTQCSIRVGKDQTLKHVIQRVSELGLPGVSRDADFLAAEVANSLVLCMCKETALVSTIKNTDNIFLFQTPKPVVVSAPVTGSPALKDAKSRALAKVMQNLDKKVNTLQLTAAPAKVAPKVNTYLRFTTNGKNFVSVYFIVCIYIVPFLMILFIYFYHSAS